MKSQIIETIARRDRVLVFVALLIVIAGSASLMQSASDALMRFGSAETATSAYFGLLFVMWWMMMMAMMLPSAAPAILLFAAMSRRTAVGNRPEFRTVFFAGGYLAIWTAFALVATLLHVVIVHFTPMTPMMALVSRSVGAVMLIAAGIFQFTSFKASCLGHCQAPALFFSQHWRRGSFGALSLGIHHGLFCVGCCALLMAILFYGGVMEPRWIAGLALYVLAEKIIPAAWRLRNVSGLILIAWGTLVLTGYF